MAVVRAGDAEPNQPADAELSSSVHPEVPPESRRGHLELSEDVGSQSSADRITPLSIPPPPGLPSDMVPSTIAREPDGRSAHRTGARSTSSLAGSAITESPQSSNRRKYGSIAVTLTAVAALAAVLGILHGRERNARKVQAAPNAPAAVSSPMLDTAVNPIDVPSAAKPVDVAPVAASNAPTSAKSASSNEPSSNNTTRVTLELMPIDAKVFLHGHEIPGPPFAFDVPIGKRLAIEVKRPGFVTAKVVIDGKKPLVHFGMLRETHH